MSEPTFADIRGDLPEHQDEVMAAHGGQPTIAEQDRTHGAGLPAEDRGVTEGPSKYSGGI